MGIFEPEGELYHLQIIPRIIVDNLHYDLSHSVMCVQEP